LEPPDQVYAAFAEAGGEGVVIAHGVPNARILMKLTSNRLFLMIEGEPTGKCLTDTFTDALATGMLKGTTPTLVDLTHYVGTVDWEAVKTVRAMAPWGKERKSNVAYVVRDNVFGNLVKIASALFTRSRHEIFRSYGAAEAWLDSIEPKD